jgi:hypothetical protein
VSTEAAAPSRAEALVTSRTFSDRLLAAFPLLAIFFWLAVVYAWQSWDHPTPWLFGDELELSQLGRAIAHTGHAARRGEPHSFDSIYTYLTAPAWWFSTVSRSYSTIKYIGVIVMSATAFPAYFLARVVASPRASLFTAATAAAIPALVYSSMIIEEPLAYPWATLCLLLIAKALLTRRRAWVVGAAAASVVAPIVKGELAVVPAIYVLAALFMWWSSERGHAWRRTWRLDDWGGWIVLVIGAVIFVVSVASARSLEVLEVTRYFKLRVYHHAMWAGGAMMIGLGVLPLVATAGTLLRAPGERPSRQLRTFRCVLVAAIVMFGFYAGIKGAYNQNHFATRVWERNVMYLAPLFLAATALWLDRRRLNPLGLLFGTGVAAYLIALTPFEMQYRFNSDAPGLTILEQANRSFAFTPTDAEIGLYVVLAIAVALLLAPQVLAQRVRFRRWGAYAVAVAVLVFAWVGAGELSAASASNSISSTFRSVIRSSNPSWVQARIGNQRTLYLGQGISDPNPENLLEFWNPGIRDVWSLDGTAPGPGPVVTPDVRGRDGMLISHPLNHDRYVVVEPGIDVAGKVVARVAHKAGGGFQTWRLVRVDPPLRLLGSVTGLYADHWSVPGGSAYTRYGRGRGTLVITVSRREWGGPDKPGRVLIRMATLRIGSDNQPHLGRITRTIHWTVHSHIARTFTIPTPGPRFRVEVDVATFRPHALVPELGDNRPLGAVLTYRFLPQR